MILRNILKALVIILVSIVNLGFDYTNHVIPTEEIRSGGPPKDGIPALTDPEFMPAQKADYLNPQDRILGLYINNSAKAYPIRILNWHELINDITGEKEVLVSYCPLCGTGMAFETNINNQRFLFGVSGLLYNSNVLFYDEGTESLWSQIKMKAVTGQQAGKELVQVPLIHTTWKNWQEKYPDTLVLTDKTGFFRDYKQNPYSLYGESEDLYFPVKNIDKRLSRKEWVLGVMINDRAKAYSFTKLRQQNGNFEDTVGGQRITIFFDGENQSAVVRDKEGHLIPSTQAYWFAWVAFYPTTELYY